MHWLRIIFPLLQQIEINPLGANVLTMMNIINKSSSDKGVACKIEKVLKESYYLLETKLKRKPPLGEKEIELRYDPVYGPKVYWPLSVDKYVIGLNVNGDYPLQMIYQLAHELCHIYIDPRINGLLIEIICHKTAIDVLEIIGLDYKSQESINNYIKELKELASEKYSVKFPTISLEWMRKSFREKLNLRIHEDREFNDIVAFILKEHTDKYDQFGIINNLRNSLICGYDVNISKLDALNKNTVVDIQKLARNIGGEMGKTISMLFADNKEAIKM